MIQLVLVILSLAAAAAYLGYTFYQNFFGKDVSCPGCGACSTVDFDKIEKELEKKFGV